MKQALSLQVLAELSQTGGGGDDVQGSALRSVLTQSCSVHVQVTAATAPAANPAPGL